MKSKTLLLILSLGLCWIASTARAGGINCDKPQLALLHFFAPEFGRKAPPEQLARDRQKIRDALESEFRAAKKLKPSVSLIVSPEMAATSYPDDVLPDGGDYANEAEVLKVAEYLPPPGFVPAEKDMAKLQKDSPTFLQFSKLARELKTTLHVALAERNTDGRVFNAVAVIGPEGQLITKHRKTHLYKGAGEDKYLTEAPINVETSTYTHPELGRVGLAICSDIDDDGDGKEDLMVHYKNAKPPLDVLALSSLWTGTGENGPEKAFALAAKYVNDEGKSNQTYFVATGNSPYSSVLGPPKGAVLKSETGKKNTAVFACLPPRGAGKGVPHGGGAVNPPAHAPSAVVPPGGKATKKIE